MGLTTSSFLISNIKINIAVMLKKNKACLENESVSLSINLNGGSINDFKLKTTGINPLSFIYPKDLMPSNNKNGATYQGHFLCLGRWGEPSSGEKNAGLPDHGQFANILWEKIISTKDGYIEMQAKSILEGLKINREVYLDPSFPIYLVKEQVVNFNALGRLFSMVQHPTIAAPFLDNKITVDCNATVGFDQCNFKNIASNTIQWKQQNIDLHYKKINTDFNHRTDIVQSYIVDQKSTYGWITAYNPTSNILIGYMWPRKDYPWIHIWEHVKEGNLIYMGLEFGDTAIHQPFHDILNTPHLFSEKTVGYIDSGETIEKKYISFMITPPQEFNGVSDIIIENEKIKLITKKDIINISFTENSSFLYELST